MENNRVSDNEFKTLDESMQLDEKKLEGISKRIMLR
ncbi:hypothetical protein J2T56_002052 [Natronobacillus azotifigens]